MRRTADRRTRRTLGWVLAVGLAGALLLPGAARAQYTANYQTNIIDGVVSNWPSSYVVGDSTFADVLIIQNNGVLNSSHGHVGYETSSSNNVVVVRGTGSVWTTGNGLYVGYSGSGNQLIVTNGGQVFETGWFGTLGTDTSSCYNVAVVTGTGSVLSIAHSLNVGGKGSGNQLIVENGGKVFSDGAAIGYDGSGLGDGSNNSVTVTGPGSTWEMLGEMRVGVYNSSNCLTVADGGTVAAPGMAISVVTSKSSNNVINVDGGNVMVTNAAGDGRLIIRRGTLTFNGGTITADRLVATNGTDSVITFAQGVLTTRGTVLSNGAPFIVGENGFGTMNLLPGQHTFGDGLVVGYNGGIGIGSVVLSGGTVNAQSLYVTNDMYSFFTFDSGTLVSGTTRVDNGVPFVVGNGTDAATFGANGGQHTFINGLTMSANSTLAGTGTVVGAITSAGIIGPGFSAGQLDVQGDLTQQPGSILSLEIGGTQQGIDYDFLNITGSGYLTGQVEIALLNGFVPSPANVFTSVYASVDLVGSFDNLVDGRLTTLGGDGSFLVSFATGGSGYLMFEDFIASLAAVPEPSVLVLLLGGALVVRWARKRRR